MPADSGLDEEKTGGNKKKMLQLWLDQNQYSRKGILRYEAIFGRTYVSVGGEVTTKDFVSQLDLKQGMKVLDIGCGTGGSAFYMARNYGVDVHGVDLATNMIAIAGDYRAEMEAAVKHRVQFYVEDATLMEYPQNFYDVVYSRDTILHIPEKEKLFRKFLSTLKPGGKLMISDYCCGDQKHSQRFLDYVASRDYKLYSVQDYGRILEKAGFQNVVPLDKTALMIDIMKMEVQKFNTIEEKFIDEFSKEDFDYIDQGWKDKQVRCNEGDQAWGLFTATK
eukprot:GFUD01043597.1.p1 GENE.GFUD01043597.1~~GFUD01043597.1.p1  ORF type:complete len:278 (+),score=73.55 GFUD01043597.1:55-888(+)